MLGDFNVLIDYIYVYLTGAGFFGVTHLSYQIVKFRSDSV